LAAPDCEPHFLKTFKDFTQRQKSASFNIDQVLQRLQEGVAQGK
jgi:hypothetical protein